jgi:hypothetical protein
VDKQIDPLVEMVAKVVAANVLVKYQPVFPFDCRDISHQVLQALSEWTGEDGSKVVRTDPDQTLPENHLPTDHCLNPIIGQIDMKAAGWVKVLPLIGKEG